MIQSNFSSRASYGFTGNDTRPAPEFSPEMTPGAKKDVEKWISNFTFTSGNSYDLKWAKWALDSVTDPRGNKGRDVLLAALNDGYALNDSKRGEIQDLAGDWAQLVAFRDNMTISLSDSFAHWNSGQYKTAHWTWHVHDSKDKTFTESLWLLNGEALIQALNELGFWFGCLDVAQKLIDAGGGPKPSKTPKEDAHASFQSTLKYLLSGETVDKRTGDFVVRNWLYQQKETATNEVQTWSTPPHSSDPNAGYFVEYFKQILNEVATVWDDVKKQEDETAAERERRRKADIFWNDYKWYMLGGTLFVMVVGFGGFRLYRAWTP